MFKFVFTAAFLGLTATAVLAATPTEILAANEAASDAAAWDAKASLKTERIISNYIYGCGE